MRSITIRGNPKPARPINAAELEEMIASGKSRGEIASHFRLSESTLNSRICNSLSLTEAKNRGKARLNRS